MQAQLMSEKVEIDPSFGRTALNGPQSSRIEFSCLIQIQNMKGEVKGNGHSLILFNHGR